MNESQLISELSAALDDATATVRAPAGAAERVRRRVRRRRLARGLAVGVPAAGLAASLVIAVSGPQLPARSPAAQAGVPHSNDHPPVLTVAYVTDRARAAMSQPPGWIVKTSGQGMVSWSELATGASRLQTFGPGGRLTSDEMEVYRGHTLHRLYVDYTTRTWWRLISKVSAVPAKPDPAASLPVPGDSAGGTVRILGHSNLDGRDTIVVQYGPPRGYKPTASAGWATEQVWLDAASYLPVQTKIFGVGPVQEQQLTWVPVTRASLARLTVTLPPGFSQVPAPPFRGDGDPGLGQIP